MRCRKPGALLRKGRRNNRRISQNQPDGGRIAALNRADVALHEHAASLFDARWESMLAALPEAERGLRFVAKGSGARARGGGSSQVTYALQ